MKKNRQEKCINVHMPKRRDGLIERELPDELILYDPETDRAFLLNHTAAAIWDLCDGQDLPEQIARRVASEFHVSEGQALDDVQGTIARFRSDRLVADYAHVPSEE